MFIASPAGGMNIEEVAQNSPHLLHKVEIDPLFGGLPYQGRELAFKLGVKWCTKQTVYRYLYGLISFVFRKDLSLLEVNPLVLTKQGNLVCLGAKISVDDNALFRHKDLLALQDLTQNDAREAEAEKFQLNYVALEGDIGCMVNGLGLQWEPWIL